MPVSHLSHLQHARPQAIDRALAVCARLTQPLQSPDQVQRLGLGAKTAKKVCVACGVWRGLRAGGAVVEGGCAGCGRR